MTAFARPMGVPSPGDADYPVGTQKGVAQKTPPRAKDWARVCSEPGENFDTSGIRPRSWTSGIRRWYKRHCQAALGK